LIYYIYSTVILECGKLFHLYYLDFLLSVMIF